MLDLWLRITDNRSLTQATNNRNLSQISKLENSSCLSITDGDGKYNTKFGFKLKRVQVSEFCTKEGRYACGRILD